jgi:hypothetical protein
LITRELDVSVAAGLPGTEHAVEQALAPLNQRFVDLRAAILPHGVGSGQILLQIPAEVVEFIASQGIDEAVGARNLAQAGRGRG